MARPRSDERRDAILAAAVRIIGSQGLSAPTALIAREAGVSNGSLFTYFETKADLLNQLYVALKTEMAAAALDGLPTGSDARERMHHVWSHWLHWAAAHPDKRRALAHLSVSDDVTVDSHRSGHRALAGIARLVEQICAEGAMRAAPLSLVMSIMSAVADATVDSMMRDPIDADAHCTVAFEAIWRMIA